MGEADGGGDEAVQSAAAQRVDAFVDASFAFSLTLLVIGGGSGPPRTLDELREALWGIPAFAAGFALLAFFWAAHREYGKLSPRRDAKAVVLSLAIVFTVLIYVYPLRLLMSSFAGWVSGGRGVSPNLVDSWDDLKTLYIIYGLGYGLLSVLYALLYAHGRRQATGLDPEQMRRVGEWVSVWRIIVAVALLSITVAALVPTRIAPWLPGMVYCLIPVSIAAMNALSKRRGKPATVAADPAPPIS